MVDNKVQNIVCENCNASLTFKPGTHSLVCSYCNFENKINSPEKQNQTIQEFDIDSYEREVFNQEETVKTAVVKCAGCSAETTLGQNLTSKDCPFCGTPLVIQQGKVKRLHKPHYLLPFAITEREASEAFKKWINSLWFAPNKLKRFARAKKKLQGIYLPFWTYDCFTQTQYRGERGDEYTVTRTNSKGESSSQVRVRWYPAGGTVFDAFDDILIPATRSLPKKHLLELEPWDLQNLQPYNDKFLHGFKTENYQLTLRQGYGQAKQRMNEVIRQTIKRDIGGDQQRIHSVSTDYRDPTFKHILLPTWTSAYRFKKKTYQYVVNARTAEVQGGRPYSWMKISVAVLVSLASIFGLWAVFAGEGLAVNWPWMYELLNSQSQAIE